MSFKRFAEAERAIKARKKAAIPRSNWLPSKSPISVLRASLQRAQPSGGALSSPLTQNGERTMWFYTKFIVRKHERGLLFRDGDFQSFLAPGEYRYPTIRHSYSVETYDTAKPAFEHRLVNYLLQAERASMDELFEVVETSATEGALVFLNEQLATVMGPASRSLYWKGLVNLQVQRVNLHDESALENSLARRLYKAEDAAVAGQVDRAVYSIAVPTGHVGLLYFDGKFSATIDSGLHAFWQIDRSVAVTLVDLRVRTLEVQGQEILTRDKVALRINVTATYQFTDAAKAARLVKDPLDHLYKEIQFGLRAAVGTRTLDNLLEDKTSIDSDVGEFLQQPFAALGIDVKSVGVKDIILPGDMKELLARVVEAEKAAQANVIRRREETNATRSLLNTAKVMESNSIALRLKELETLERVTENVGSLSVYGGLDAVMDGLVRLSPQKAS